MALKTKKKTVIDDVPFGCYLWQLPDGRVIADDEGNYFMLFAREGDREAVGRLRDAVKGEFGITEGKPLFARGHRPVNDDELEEQRQRMIFGLEPDPMNLQDVYDKMKRREV